MGNVEKVKKPLTVPFTRIKISSSATTKQIKEFGQREGKDEEFELKSSDFDEGGGKPSSFVGDGKTSQLEVSHF